MKILILLNHQWLEKMMPNKTSEKIKGFTIIEMAIVIVIIGLIVAAILGGESLIQSSKRQAIIASLKKYQVAFDQFNEKYYAVPGDMGDAVNTLGASHDGNNNGLIDPTSTDPNRFEAYGFWQDLELAHLIEGTYSGSMSNGVNATLGVDVPAGPYPNSGYTAQQWSLYTANETKFRSTNVIIFGAASTGHSITSAVISSREAFMIDQKMDDGMPFKGRLWTNTSTACTNFTDDNNYDNDTYLNNSDTNKQCILIYFLTEALKS